MSTGQHHGAATVKQFADELGLSRWSIQRLIAAGEIRSVKIGKARRIPWSELPRLLERSEVSTRAEGAA
jgi:excisionase family DNA binding protein